MWNRWTIGAAAGAVAASMWMGAYQPLCRGCGPDFPNTLIGATDANLLAAPRADITVELDRIVPAHATGLKAVVPHEYHLMYGAEQTNELDAADLSAALLAAGMGKGEREALVGKLAAWRKGGEQGEIPVGMPEEFVRYERGAVKYHAQDLAGARQEWNGLLGLPEGQRKWRTVWAVYMVARSYSDAEPARAAGLFAEVRGLGSKGFADSLGLGVASLGWEAKARWGMGQREAAMELYLEQVHAGDPWAPWSLRDCAAELLAGDDAKLMAAAKDAVSRQIVTAYLVAHGGPAAGHMDNEWLKRSKRWVELMVAAGVKEMRGADRLAWVAYQANDMVAADRWLTLGGAEGEGTAVGQWIRAKLAMRAGKMDVAMAALAKAREGFPKNEEWNAAAGGYDGDLPWRPEDHVAGELALLKLGRGQFVESMNLLYRAGFWEDAAYLAERVLTVEELKGYVDRNFSKPEKAEAKVMGPGGEVRGYPVVDSEGVINGSLRYLLARRLARVGKWQEARGYYPEKVVGVFDEYIADIRTGHDAKRPAGERAAALWGAAKLARNQGMELLGTDVGPDDAIWSGAFDLGSETKKRLEEARQPAVRKLSPVSGEEQKRLALPMEEVDKRWHYRYVALEHAWAAAALMPDESEALAKMLVEAGKWVAGKDPQAADRFYKALVVRCGTTELGRRAAEVKWFP